MEDIAISEFKAKCQALLERVRKTRKPIRVTRFGIPVAEIIPPPLAGERGNWLGSMAGTAEVLGDIVSPVIENTD